MLIAAGIIYVIFTFITGFLWFLELLGRTRTTWLFISNNLVRTINWWICII